MQTNFKKYLAPAKLNLFLHITSRRADGYHCLQTIFQFIDLNDVLQFIIREDGKFSCKSSAINLPPEQDIVLHAAKLLQQYTNLGVDIQVEKNIPMGGGLGGGSSDAATTLLALNHLWELNLSIDILAKLGLSLGADVPVFIHGHAAWAEGIGESLKPITLKEPWYLVVHPGCSVSTAEIFNAKDLTRNTKPIIMSDFIAAQTKNDCEEVVRSRYPSIGQALDWLNQYSQARLTGTGACIFAAFDNYSDTQKVLKQLPNKWQGFIAQGKNTSPSIIGV